MFVTREEREPLGGIISYWLPVSLSAAAFFFALASVSFASVMDNYFDQQAGIVLWTGAAAAGATLFFLGGKGRWLKALVAAFVIGVLSGLWGWLGHAAYAGLALVPVIALAAGIVDRRRQSRSMWPYWPIVFARFIAIPVTAVMIAFIVALVTIPALAAMDIGGIEMLDSGAVDTALLAGGMVLAGLLAAFVRRQRVLVGAVRYALIWIAPYALPILVVIAAVYAATSLPAASIQGAHVWLATLLGAGVVLIYQTGDQQRVPLWLAVTVVLAVAVKALLLVPVVRFLPNFNWSGGEAFSLGLIRSLPLLLLPLWLVLAIGSLSQLIPGKRAWMAPLAPLLTVWVVMTTVYPALWSLAKYATG